MNFKNCIYCEETKFSVCRGQIYCIECATVQPRYLVNDFLSYQIKKTVKKNYQKKGVKQQMKTEYFNIIKEFDVEGSKELIDQIINLNEKFINACKEIFFLIVGKKEIKESFFKRNYFINQNVVLFFVLVQLKRFDVLDKIIERFKYSESLKLKKIYLEQKDKIDLRKIKNKKIEFILNLLNHQESQEEESETSFLLNSI
uniref:Tlr 7Rp protein n=1 Tax=Tetrahymena thermophila TaxID=5911 RepID=Q8WRC5_TETTH|nr:Tlr 7Rp protein [Tetrahymena thermophila]